MLNKAILAGRLTKNPEMSATPSGTIVAKFTLAVNRRFNREETDFISIVCFNKTAEFVEKYFTKGQAAIVVGSIQTRSWEADGQKRYATDVIADEVNFCGSKKDNENTTQEAPQEAPQEYERFETVDDDDLPF